ncbi:MAG: LysM peptidoglycan-binding domain-containing protein [Firmicutes bacterium]|nr:LysM peptidoglycan-binding domain-containing protein [Bacillota bacterium]
MELRRLFFRGTKQKVAIFVILGLLILFLEEGIAQGATHRVMPGDNLWLLARRYNSTVQEIAAANNLSSPWIIYPEQVLTIPEGEGVHIIQKGETLWHLSIRYNIDLQDILKANPGIDPYYLLPGQKIVLPKQSSQKPLSSNLASRGGRTATSWGFSAQEIDLLARLVHSESAGEPYIGQVAVAATVLNRLESHLYPNTLSGVINQVINGYYQYSPVLDGRINLPAGETAYNAVYDALKGWDPSGNALGFYNPKKTGNQWVRQQQVTTVIGNHVFFR